MGATQFAFVFDPNSLDDNGNPNIVMIIKPDTDAQLSDLGFNPRGCVQMRLPLDQYKDPQISGVAHLQATILGYKPPPVQSTAA